MTTTTDTEPVTTGIRVAVVDGRSRTRLRPGLVRPQRVHAAEGRCRIVLVGTSALLLGGDDVRLDVEVGPGARLELAEAAGTVAYHGRGHPASWRTRVRLAPGASLLWSGEPFVVADGADVRRSLDLELAAGATALLRETLVLGRAGECGGRLRTSTSVTVEDRLVLLEDTDLDPGGLRFRPGLLGPHRLVDSVLALGTPVPRIAGAVRLRLSGDAGSLSRHLGSEPARSPLSALWSELCAGWDGAPGPPG